MTDYLAIIPADGHGIADRLLDLIISYTYIQLINSENTLSYYWKQTKPFCEYSISNHIEIPGCTFIYELNTTSNLVSFNHNSGGNNTPKLFENIFPIHDIKITYHSLIRSIKFKNESYVDNDINKCIGLHCRRGDKYKKNKHNVKPSVMNFDEFRYIENRCKEFISKNKEHQYYFVASDDHKYKKYIVDYLKSHNKTIVNIDYCDDIGENVIRDLCALSNCKMILQWTKYSSFSVLASLIKNVPIVNVFDKEPNHFNVWLPYINGKII